MSKSEFGDIEPSVKGGLGLKDRLATSETVFGTSDDDYCEESTSAIPTFVDVDSMNRLQKEIIEKRFIFPDLSGRDLSKNLDCCETTVYKYINEFVDVYEDELYENGLYEKVSFNRPYSSEEQSSKSDERKQIRDYLRKNMEATSDECLEELGLQHIDGSVVGGIRRGIQLDEKGHNSAEGDSGYEGMEQRSIVRAYFLDNQDATVYECIADTGVDLSVSVISGIKGGVMSEKVRERNRSVQQSKEDDSLDDSNVSDGTIHCEVRGVIDRELVDKVVGDGVGVLDFGDSKVTIVRLRGG